jgi:hypothetical protein
LWKRLLKTFSKRTKRNPRNNPLNDMEKFSKSEKVVIKVGPPGNPYAKIMLTERRISLKDRRRLNTYLSTDKRKGIADRRKPKK